MAQTTGTEDKKAVDSQIHSVEIEIPRENLLDFINPNCESSGIDGYFKEDPLGEMFSALYGDLYMTNGSAGNGHANPFLTLRRLYFEILRNAIGSMGSRASEEGYTGRLEIAWIIRHGRLEFSMADNGKGVQRSYTLGDILEDKPILERKQDEAPTEDAHDDHKQGYGSHDHKGLKDCAEKLKKLDPLANLVLRDKDEEKRDEGGAIVRFSVTLQALVDTHGEETIIALSSSALLRKYLLRQYPEQEGLS